MAWSGAETPPQSRDATADRRTNSFAIHKYVASLPICLATFAASALAILEIVRLSVTWLPLAYAGAAALLAAYLLYAHFRRYRLLESAVDNMWQGLAVFDAEGRLVLHNRQFCSLLGLPYAQVQRAATGGEIAELLIRAGGYDGASGEAVWRLDEAFISRRTPALDYIDLPGKRTVAQSHEPLTGGGWVRTYADVTGRRQIEARIVHLALHDALTDLPNRALFRERLEKALLNATPRSQVAIMILDLNRFKEVNDTEGHAVGDQLLMRVADRMQRAVRDSDTVARLGGDEFAIIQVGIESRDQGRELAERVISVCDVPYEINGVTVAIGVSIGISFAPTDGVGADELLKVADEAMYRAKSEPRSSYRCSRGATPVEESSIANRSRRVAGSA